VNILKQKQIRDFTKKNPKWKNVFLEWLEHDDNLNIPRLKSVFETLFKYKDLLKNDITLEYAKALTSIHFDKKSNIFSRLFTRTDQDIVEVFSDNIDSTLHTKQKNNFIKSLKTKRYEHLFTNEVEFEINTILDNNITISSMKSQFFKKLASFKTSKELLVSLKSFKSKNVNWNEDYYLGKIKKDKSNVNIISSINSTLMIEVKDYDACKTLGSQAWCIVKHNSSFNSYTKDLQRQLIYFDFKLPIEDNNSIIGFTISPNGSVKNSHLKNDDRTSKEIISNFKFQPASNEIIDQYLSSLTESLAFKYIIKNDLVDHYDNFVNKNTILVKNTYNQLSEDIVKEIDRDNDRYNNTFKLEKFSHDNSSFEIGYNSKNGNIKLVEKFLLEGKHNPSKQNNWAIRAASYSGQHDVVNLLIKNDQVDPSANNNEALMMAIQGQHTQTFINLLRDERVLNLISGNDELLIANKYNATDIFKILLTLSETDVNKDNNLVFIDAIKTQKFKHIEILLDELIFDYASNDNEIVKELLNNNMYHEINRLIDKNLIDPSFNDNYIIKEMTKKEINTSNDRDLTTLEIAQRNGNDHVIKTLTVSPKMKKKDSEHISCLSKKDFIQKLSINEKVLSNLSSQWVHQNINNEFKKTFLDNLKKPKKFPKL
jgi:hypothetical protein